VRYEPREEAFVLPEIAFSTESETHSISTVGSLSVEFLRTKKLAVFLEGLSNARDLRIAVYSYQQFYPDDLVMVWTGCLERLPEGDVVYPVDKIGLTFITPEGAWGDGDDLTDPLTGTWFQHKHVTDVIIPAIIRRAFSEVPGEATIRGCEVKGDAPFFSSIERPIKALAGGEYRTAGDVLALAWDTTRRVLYAGVHDATGSGTKPWLVSYNPVTRRWEKATEFRYTGSKTFLRPPTEWVVSHLEYDASTDKIFYVCRTNHPNLLDPQAHYHIYGNFSAATIPEEVELVDANAFTLHDRGFVVRSKYLLYDNRGYDGKPPSVEGVDHYADLEAEQIGWGTPHHQVKECGVLRPSPRIAVPVWWCGVTYGSPVVKVMKKTDKRLHPRVGQRVEFYELTTHYSQDMGAIKAIVDKGSYFEVTCATPCYYYKAIEDTGYVFLTDAGVLPSQNLFCPRPQSAQIRWLFPDDIASPHAEAVSIERRLWSEGAMNAYWKSELSNVSPNSGEPVYISDIGYISFSSSRGLEVVDRDSETVIYRGSPVAPFEVMFRGYNPAFLLRRGFTTRSALQPGHHARPGKCRLCYNGATVLTSEGKPLETYGDIYLWDDDGAVYAAWEEHGQDASGTWYIRIAAGRWDGSRMLVMFRDRIGDSWSASPDRYLTGFLRRGGKMYFGTKQHSPVWIDTPLRIYMATPPDDASSPRVYYGGLAASAVVLGDKGDIIKSGSVIRLRAGRDEPPGVKRYRVVDVNVVSRRINQTAWWDAYEGVITLFTVLSIDRIPDGITYAEAARGELLGRYITIEAGFDTRGEVMVRG